MKPGTLEQKIAKLPEDLQYKVEEYLELLINSDKKSFIAAEPEVIYHTPAAKNDTGNWKALIAKFEKLSPDSKIEVEKNIEILLATEAKSKTAKPRAKFGELKGFVTYMSDDFDAPLEEFKDYM